MDFKQTLQKECVKYHIYGLYIDGIISGVVTYGMSPSLQHYSINAGEEYKSIVYELNRLITENNLLKNVLSTFVSKTFKLLPKPSIIVSFADPNSILPWIYLSSNEFYLHRDLIKHNSI